MRTKDLIIIASTVIVCAMLLFTFGLVCMDRDYEAKVEAYRTNETANLLRENLDAIQSIDWGCKK